METVVLRREALQRALLTLEEGIKGLDGLVPDKSLLYRLMRDGLIQRFEYCIDSFWKFSKLYLENIQQLPIEIASPRVILRLMLDFKLITKDECRVLLACVADRNLTSHTYNETTADKIHHHIPLYHATMKTVVERLNF
jgi:nucleotidyltransferase substrate binding protein (TIGR01987 family)